MAGLRRAGLACLAVLLLACNAFAWPAQPDQRTVRAQAPESGEILVTGARVLDSGLLEPLPRREDAPRPTGPVTLIGGVDGVEGVVAVPGEVRPQDRLATPPEREYRLLSQAAKVYALPGQSVGYGYVLAGSPVGVAVPVQIAVTLPQHEGAERRTETLEREAVLGRADWAAWDFPADAPVEGGQYVIEVRCQGVELSRRAFLVAPRAMPTSPSSPPPVP